MDECKLLPCHRSSRPSDPTLYTSSLWPGAVGTTHSPSTQSRCPSTQGLTLLHFRAQLEDFRDTSLTLELNLSTFGTHAQVSLGYMGDTFS